MIVTAITKCCTSAQITINPVCTWQDLCGISSLAPELKAKAWYLQRKEAQKSPALIRVGRTVLYVGCCSWTLFLSSLLPGYDPICLCAESFIQKTLRGQWLQKIHSCCPDNIINCSISPFLIMFSVVGSGVVSESRNLQKEL